MIKIVNSKTAMLVSDEGAVDEVIEIPAHGRKAGRLTQFGETWVDTNRIVAIEFSPEDGCGVELTLDTPTGTTIHCGDEDAAAFLCWLQAESSQVAQLEALAAR